MSQNSLSPRTRGGRGRLVVFAACVSALGVSSGYSLGQLAAGAVRLNTNLDVTADSNAFGNTSDLSDIFYTFQPQLAYDRTGGRGTAHFDAGVGFLRHDKYSELDSDNWTVNGMVELPRGSGGRLTGTLNFQFFDGSESDEFIGQHVDMTRLDFNLGSSYQISGLTSVRFGATMNRYDTNVRPIASSWSLRGGISKQFRPSLSAFFDYTHGSTDSKPATGETYAADYTTDNFAVGLDGQMSPKISGSVSAGYANYSARTGDSVGSSNGFTANVALNWQARVNTRFSIGGGKSNRIVSSGESIDATTVTFSVDQRLGVGLKANGQVLWETFATRGANGTSDDRVALNLKLDYSLRDHFGLGGGVTHNVRYSQDPRFDISRTLVNVFARYSF